MFEDVLKRYTPAQRYKINEFFRVLALRTRKSKRISESRKENILKSWEKYDADVVLDGMNTFLNMTTTAVHNEKYVGGIIRNKQKNKKVSTVGRGTGDNITDKKYDEIRREGERLKIGKIKENDLDCDF